MQEPGELPLTMYQGANFDYNMTYSINNAPFDLTNYTARMQVRETYDASSTYLSLTSGSGITLGGTAGTILIEANAATTAGVPVGNWAYDLELVSNAGYVTRLIEGVFTVDPEVTK